MKKKQQHEFVSKARTEDFYNGAPAGLNAVPSNMINPKYVDENWYNTF